MSYNNEDQTYNDDAKIKFLEEYFSRRNITEINFNNLPFHIHNIIYSYLEMLIKRNLLYKLGENNIIYPIVKYYSTYADVTHKKFKSVLDKYNLDFVIQNSTNYNEIVTIINDVNTDPTMIGQMRHNTNINDLPYLDCIPIELRNDLLLLRNKINENMFHFGEIVFKKQIYQSLQLTTDTPDEKSINMYKLIFPGRDLIRDLYTVLHYPKFDIHANNIAHNAKVKKFTIKYKLHFGIPFDESHTGNLCSNKISAFIFSKHITSESHSNKLFLYDFLDSFTSREYSDLRKLYDLNSDIKMVYTYTLFKSMLDLSIKSENVCIDTTYTKKTYGRFNDELSLNDPYCSNEIYSYFSSNRNKIESIENNYNGNYLLSFATWIVQNDNITLINEYDGNLNKNNTLYSLFKTDPRIGNYSNKEVAKNIVINTSSNIANKFDENMFLGYNSNELIKRILIKLNTNFSIIPFNTYYFISFTIYILAKYTKNINIHTELLKTVITKYSSIKNHSPVHICTQILLRLCFFKISKDVFFITGLNNLLGSYKRHYPDLSFKSVASISSSLSDTSVHRISVATSSCDHVTYKPVIQCKIQLYNHQDDTYRDCVIKYHIYTDIYNQYILNYNNSNLGETVKNNLDAIYSLYSTDRCMKSLSDSIKNAYNIDEFISHEFTGVGDNECLCINCSKFRKHFNKKEENINSAILTKYINSSFAQNNLTELLENKEITDNDNNVKYIIDGNVLEIAFLTLKKSIYYSFYEEELEDNTIGLCNFTASLYKNFKINVHYDYLFSKKYNDEKWILIKPFFIPFPEIIFDNYIFWGKFYGNSFKILGEPYLQKPNNKSFEKFMESYLMIEIINNHITIKKISITNPCNKLDSIANRDIENCPVLMQYNEINNHDRLSEFIQKIPNVCLVWNCGNYASIEITQYNIVLGYDFATGKISYGNLVVMDEVEYKYSKWNINIPYSFILRSNNDEYKLLIFSSENKLDKSERLWNTEYKSIPNDKHNYNRYDEYDEYDEYDQYDEYDRYADERDKHVDTKIIPNRNLLDLLNLRNSVLLFEIHYTGLYIKSSSSLNMLYLQANYLLLNDTVSAFTTLDYTNKLIISEASSSNYKLIYDFLLYSSEIIYDNPWGYYYRHYYSSILNDFNYYFGNNKSKSKTKNINIHLDNRFKFLTDKYPSIYQSNITTDRTCTAQPLERNIKKFIDRISTTPEEEDYDYDDYDDYEDNYDSDSDDGRYRRSYRRYGGSNRNKIISTKLFQIGKGNSHFRNKREIKTIDYPNMNLDFILFKYLINSHEMYYVQLSNSITTYFADRKSYLPYEIDVTPNIPYNNALYLLHYGNHIHKEPNTTINFVSYVNKISHNNTDVFLLKHHNKQISTGINFMSVFKNSYSKNLVNINVKASNVSIEGYNKIIQKIQSVNKFSLPVINLSNISDPEFKKYGNLFYSNYKKIDHSNIGNEIKNIATLYVFILCINRELHKDINNLLNYIITPEVILYKDPIYQIILEKLMNLNNDTLSIGKNNILKPYNFIYHRITNKILSQINSFFIHIGLHTKITIPDSDLCKTITDTNIQSLIDYVKDNIESDIGTYVSNLDSIKEIVQYVEEIYYLVDTIHFKQNKEEYNSIKIMYEFLFGGFMRPHQHSTIDSIYKEAYSGNKKFYQLLMGEGKSSVIVPTLSLMLSSLNSPKKFNSIVINIPQSLVIQTVKTIWNYIGYIFPYDILSINITKNELASNNLMYMKLMNETKGQLVIMNDISMKCMLLNSVCDKSYQTDQFTNQQYCERMNNSYIICDEIDDMINPIKSELNYPSFNKENISNIELLYNFMYIMIYEIYVDENNKETLSTNAKLYEHRGNVPHFHITNDIDTFDEKYEIINIAHNAIMKFLSSFFINKFTSVNEIVIQSLETVSDLINLLREESNMKKKIKKITDNNPETINIYFTIKKCTDVILNNIIKSIHRVNFGMLTRHGNDITFKGSEENDLFAVPFTASDTPNKRSLFSDKIFTIAYTILAYLDKNSHQLRNGDIDRYLAILRKNYKENNDAKLKHYYENIIFEQDLGEKKYMKFILYSLSSSEISDEYLANIKSIESLTKMYLNYIFTNYLKVSTEQYTATYYDIISSNFSKYRTGFTGTPFIIKPIDINDTQSFNTIQYRDIDSGSIVASIIGLGADEIPNVHFIDESNDILRSITNYIIKGNYGCLIDIGAFLIKYKLIDIIANLAKAFLENNSYKYIVYIESNDIMYYVNTKIMKPVEFNNDLPLSEMFVIFDQKHITGQDIKQNKYTKGLITLRTNNRMRDAGQGIFRLRMMNKGQTIDICMFSNVKKNYNELNGNEKNIKIVNMLMENENLYENNQKTIHAINNSMTLIRNSVSEHKNNYKSSLNNPESPLSPLKQNKRWDNSESPLPPLKQNNRWDISESPLPPLKQNKRWDNSKKMKGSGINSAYDSTFMGPYYKNKSILKLSDYEEDLKIGFVYSNIYEYKKDYIANIVHTTEYKNNTILQKVFTDKISLMLTNSHSINSIKIAQEQESVAMQQQEQDIQIEQQREHMSMQLTLSSYDYSYESINNIKAKDYISLINHIEVSNSQVYNIGDKFAITKKFIYLVDEFNKDKLEKYKDTNLNYGILCLNDKILITTVLEIIYIYALCYKGLVENNVAIRDIIGQVNNVQILYNNIMFFHNSKTDENLVNKCDIILCKLIGKYSITLNEACMLLNYLQINKEKISVFIDKYTYTNQLNTAHKLLNEIKIYIKDYSISMKSCIEIILFSISLVKTWDFSSLNGANIDTIKSLIDGNIGTLPIIKKINTSEVYSDGKRLVISFITNVLFDGDDNIVYPDVYKLTIFSIHDYLVTEIKKNK